MKKLIFLLSVSCALSGCASQGMTAYQQARRDCDTGGGKSSADCMKHHSSFSSFPAYAQRAVTYAAVVMEQKRAGKLTENEADLLVSEYNAKLEGEVAAAETVRQQNLNQALGDTGATLLAVDAMNRSRPAPQQPRPINIPRPVQTTCSPNGGTVQCTTY